MNLGWPNDLRFEESIMLLGYIYNDFILNLFLKHSSCTCQEKIPLHVEEPNVAKQLV